MASSDESTKFGKALLAIHKRLVSIDAKLDGFRSSVDELNKGCKRNYAHVSSTAEDVASLHRKYARFEEEYKEQSFLYGTAFKSGYETFKLEDKEKRSEASRIGHASRQLPNPKTQAATQFIKNEAKANLKYSEIGKHLTVEHSSSELKPKVIGETTDGKKVIQLPLDTIETSLKVTPKKLPSPPPKKSVLLDLGQSSNPPRLTHPPPASSHILKPLHGLTKVTKEPEVAEDIWLSTPAPKKDRTEEVGPQPKTEAKDDSKDPGDPEGDDSFEAFLASE